ncbi:MAG: YihY/virulence factor BrkB family protein [Nitriliruptor sp.]
MTETALNERVRERWRAVARRLPPGINRIAERIAGRDLLLEASSLAFYGLVSSLPLLTITFSIVGAVAGEESLRQFAQQAEENGPAGTGQILQSLLENSGGLSVAAIVFTIWPATAYGGGLRRALTRATAEDESAPALRGRATAIGLVLALPVLSLAGLPLAAFLTTLGDDGLAGTLLGWGLALVAGMATLTLVLSALYHAFTPDDLDVKDTIRGAALTAAVTTVFSVGFIAYLRLGNVEERFGGATIGLIVMLGVYLFVANALLLAGFEASTELDNGDLREGDRG